MARVTTVVAAVLLTLAVAGCSEQTGDGGGDGGNAATTEATTEDDGGSGDAVAWADEVCSELQDDLSALTTQPEIDQSNPQAAKDSLVTYLGTLETSLDGMASAVEDAGTPPVDGGEEAVEGFVSQIGTAKEAVTSAKTKVEGASVNDPAGFQKAVTSAVEDLQSLSELDPTNSFSENQELNKAYEDAESCQELEAGTTPTS